MEFITNLFSKLGVMISGILVSLGLVSAPTPSVSLPVQPSVPTTQKTATTFITIDTTDFKNNHVLTGTSNAYVIDKVEVDTTNGTYGVSRGRADGVAFVARNVPVVEGKWKIVVPTTGNSFPSSGCGYYQVWAATTDVVKDSIDVDVCITK